MKKGSRLWFEKSLGLTIVVTPLCKQSMNMLFDSKRHRIMEGITIFENEGVFLQYT